MLQFSSAVRDAALNAIETTIGTSPTMEIRSGAPPAATSTADSGTLLATITLPSNWMNDSSGGVKTLLGSWSVTVGTSGSPGHFRIKQAGSPFTVHEQGSCGLAVPLTTSGTTAANSNVLNFSSTTGVVVGMRAVGTGILDDTYVIAVGGSTVTLSKASTAGVSSGVSISFRPDLVLDSSTVTAGQTFTVTGHSIQAGAA